MRLLPGVPRKGQGARMFTLNSILRTIQGEGVLAGIPMVFVRFAGCSVGCSLCDTDYTRKSKMSASKILVEVCKLQVNGWVWVTGGEPTDQKNIEEVRLELQRQGYKVAIATAGIRPVSDDWDFISVSPHSLSFVQRSGDQLNIVPGLNGLSLEAVSRQDFSGFDAKYLTPCDGDPCTVKQCVDFILHNAGWRLGCQSHKVWGIP